MLPYAWARMEQVDGAMLVRLSDGSLTQPQDVVVTDLETNAAPIDQDGKALAIVAVSSNEIEFFDYDAVITGDEFPTRKITGRYSVVAQPLED